ncbi:MAG: twin-arginine translocation signal domain-containing protein, partial [Planctomicrobium sp.]|nr:twin-arginine translocation signal domain-containing protein [Planctomicrobium sp.]
MTEQNTNNSRRDFLKTGATVGATTALLSNFAASSKVFAAGDDTIR